MSWGPGQPGLLSRGEALQRTVMTDSLPVEQVGKQACRGPQRSKWFVHGELQTELGQPLIYLAFGTPGGPTPLPAYQTQHTPPLKGLSTRGLPERPLAPLGSLNSVIGEGVEIGREEVVGIQGFYFKSYFF